MTYPEVLKLERVAVHAGARQLLEPTSLTLPAGCIVGLIGNNGSGKTSLLRTIAGYSAQRTGRIFICDRPVETIRGADRLRYLCYVPQSLEHVPLLSVEEFLAAAGNPYGSSSSALDRACTLCSLDDLRDRLLTMLSAGELRRALIATCFLIDSPLVILDEPTSNLDPANQHRVLGLLQKMKQAGRTVLFTTHSFACDLQITDTVFSIYGQRVHRESEPGTRIDTTTLERIYGIKFAEMTAPSPILDENP